MRDTTSRPGVGWLRAAFAFAVVTGWLASVVGCVPAAVYLGIWLSGWEEPAGMIQGADTNPFYSGAGLEILLSFVVLEVLVNVLWLWVLSRGTYRRQH